MTTPESRLRELVDEVLTDAGHPEDAALRSALESIGSLASTPAPEPSGELARLMAGGGDELARRRRSGRHRPTVVGLAVIAGMGLGIGGVAATAGSAPGSSAASVQHLLADWSPDRGITHGATAAPEPGYRGGAVPEDQTPESVPSAVSASDSAETPEGAGTTKGKELRPDSESVASPGGKPGCGSPEQTKATGICPPAAGPGTHLGGSTAGDTATPGKAAKKEMRDEGRPGRASAIPVPDSPQPGTPRRVPGNGDVRGMAGPKQGADSGPGKPAPEEPSPSNSGQGSGNGRETAPGSK
ncbi:hypothetical protein [Pseudarthrobacter chlorophenolicus]|uniref:hypothetical protein n=1 Tax=Pseudarthrobacter chlorophenolicus TaxID=85085 RepID=UPI000696E55C|nr:hypothetical protein [Pseudarthrobacter chlorophenolicus]